jgi:hypothetical protein
MQPPVELQPAPEEEGQSRAALWRALGASAAEAGELSTYARNAFDFSSLPQSYPLADEPFVSAWQSYADAARAEGVLVCLRARLVQLRFPIRAGISASEAYRAATLRGVLPETGGPELELDHPGGLQLFVHRTPAGRVPVILAEGRDDFVRLVQAFAYRNEPRAVPPSMGASMVSGYNNWDRIGLLRRRWDATPPGERCRADWSAEFQEIVRQPALYQDRFILVSAGPYSGVAAAQLELADEDWSRRSLVMRLEHECTHYFTRHVLGSMRNNIADELIADYMGIVASEGRYRPDWFLRFVGLEGPQYRSGARLEVYRGALSDGAFRILQIAVRRAVENLDRFDQRRRQAGGPWNDSEKARTIIALSRPGLESLAGLETNRAVILPVS